MKTSEFEDVQKLAVQNVFCTTEELRPVGKKPEIANVFKSYSAEAVNAVFGDWGHNFYEFFSNIDATHPDIVGLISEAESKLLCESLQLSKYITENKLGAVGSVFGKLIKKHNYDLYQRIGDPAKKVQYVRILGTREAREKARSEKTVRSINIKTFIRDGEAVWRELPSSFSGYVRLNDTKKEEMAKAEKMIEQYKRLRCESLQMEVKAYIESLKKTTTEDFCGFHVVSMSDAAVLLAKLHDGRITQSPMVDGYTISISSAIFDGYVFDVDGGKSDYIYAPRAYPFSDFSSIASGAMTSIVDHLEKFPEMNGRPIFDHLVVIVPGIEYKRRVIVAVDGKKQEFYTEQECLKFLDFELVRRGSIRPILIGERDGKCYFISYFESK